jgi:hypothetical protein
MNMRILMTTIPRLTLRCAASAALCVIGAFASPRAVRAQLPVPTFGIAGGVSHFSLATTGSAPFGAVRLDLPLASLVLDGSLGAFRPNEGTVQRTYIIPEAQLQWQILPMIVRPYVGVGIGAFRAVTGPSPAPHDVTYSASAGVRIGLPLLGFGLRAEARTRGIGSGFDHKTTELTVGVSK